MRQLYVEFNIKKDESLDESDDIGNDANKTFKKLHCKFGHRVVVDRISLDQLYKNIKVKTTVEEIEILLKNIDYKYAIIQDRLDKNDSNKIELSYFV